MTLSKADIRLPAVLAAASVLWSCGGSGRSGDSAEDSATSVAESVRIIESRPAAFDARSLEEMAAAIDAEADFTAEDMALMLVAAEAGAGHLQSMLDDLGRNGDPADTYGVLTELAVRPWTAALVKVTFFLNRLPLNASERQRAADVKSALDRASVSASELEQSQLGGKPTGLQSVLTTDLNQ